MSEWKVRRDEVARRSLGFGMPSYIIAVLHAMPVTLRQSGDIAKTV